LSNGFHGALVQVGAVPPATALPEQEADDSIVGTDVEAGFFPGSSRKTAI
jgi:hypothetical protein